MCKRSVATGSILVVQVVTISRSQPACTGRHQFDRGLEVARIRYKL
jgi:hypothetical protein